MTRIPDPTTTHASIDAALARLEQEGVLTYDGRWDATEPQEDASAPSDGDEAPEPLTLGTPRRTGKRGQKRQFVITELYGISPLLPEDLSRFHAVVGDVGEDLDAGVRGTHVRPQEHCEMCGRLLSVFNLSWWPQRDGTFVFNCRDEARCRTARIKEFGKEFPEV